MRPHGAIAQIRHRHSSGRLDELWEYDPARRAVIVRVSVGADVVDIDVPVCSQRAPKPNRWVVIRRGEDHWTLSATLWPREDNLLARAHAFDERLPIGSIELLAVPPHVQEELALLESSP